MTTLNLSPADPATAKTDVLIVGVTRGPDGPRLAAGAEPVDAAFGGRLLEALVAVGATGRAGEVSRLATLGATTAPAVVAVGLGEANDSVDPEALRRGAGAGIRAAAGSRRATVALPAEAADAVRAICEGSLLGAYAFDRYRTTEPDRRRPPVRAVTVAAARAGARGVVRRAEAVTAAVRFARDLVNTPPCDLHPAEFAAAAVELAAEAGVRTEVLDERALRRGRYGGILGVGAGSAHPPRLVHLRYTPKRARGRLALVGKGITFDSGGLSLKPAAAMEDMKSDMAGAAAVVAATSAIARLSVPVEVDTWAPMAENLPSGSAIRPSDVLTMYGGKRVEVLNTDAEGRLILGDALVRASAERPDHMLDVATLTGAQLVALGARTAAVMSNDDAFREQVVAAAGRAGEAMWPMPLPEELRPSLDSEVADLANVGDRNGGMLVAGLFLREFVGERIPWAHLDIAGPAWNTGDPYGYTPKGGTGAAVRTLVQLAEELAAG